MAAPGTGKPSLVARLNAHPNARLVFAALPLVALAGAMAWAYMPRQEDPTFPARFGAVTVFFPGADAEDVERLVLNPLEEHLAQVDEIGVVRSEARAGVAIVGLELREEIYDTHWAWDEVREALGKARADLPQGASEPDLDDAHVQLESMVFAVTGSQDSVVLRRAARRLRRTLLQVEGVARVTLIADPGEQVTIDYDPAAARRLGVNPRMLAAQLRGRNGLIPGGSIRVGEMRAMLRPEADFGTVEEIARTPVVLPSGAAVELGDLATVRHGPVEPKSVVMRYNGRQAVALGVIARDASHLVELGGRVRTAVDAFRREIEPLAVEEVTFQPAYVADRLDGLGMSLGLSIIIVALVLFLFMGRRSALIVASMVPLVALGALAVFWVGGGVLHQMSIAAFVIALGMLVDNAIVVVDAIQARIDGGESPSEASRGAVRDLGVPLGVATATTVAAFLPMLLAAGTTADFIRAIPVVIILALGLSLITALVAIPTFSAIFLQKSETKEGRLERIAAHIGGIGVRRYRAVLGVAALLLAASVLGLGVVDQRFFPAADRNQIVIDLRMREGTHLDQTNEVAGRVEALLADREDITSVTTFVGRSTPRFYYNLALEPHAPHLAQVLVTTQHYQDNAAVAAAVREVVAEALPEVQIVVRPMEQGPYIIAPIEVRLYGEEPRAVATASEHVLRTLKGVPDALDVRSDLDLGAPTVRMNVVDAAAGRRGVTRSDVAAALLGQSRGIEVGEYRGGETAVPIVLRSGAGESTAVEDLRSVSVPTHGGGIVPVGQVATREVEWRPASIRHRNGRRITRVTAMLPAGVPFGGVLDTLRSRLAEEDLPAGVTLEYGGAVEGAGDANASMMRVFPIGLLLIVVCLLWEFRSFRRMAIVMVTVPLSAVGVVPGLILANEPFGFMSMLGVIALAGIVVNNAIVLLDVVERERAGGAGTEEALRAAVRVRTRPILLTTGTTVAGLLPLALSSSTLWPPLAWALISGLIASTFLTLLVVPALYRMLLGRQPAAGASAGHAPAPGGMDDTVPLLTSLSGGGDSEPTTLEPAAHAARSGSSHASPPQSLPPLPIFDFAHSGPVKGG